MDRATDAVGRYEEFGTTLAGYSFSKEETGINAAVLIGTAAMLRCGAYLVVLHSKALKFS